MSGLRLLEQFLGLLGEVWPSRLHARARARRRGGPEADATETDEADDDETETGDETDDDEATGLAEALADERAADLPRPTGPPPGASGGRACPSGP